MEFTQSYFAKPLATPASAPAPLISGGFKDKILLKLSASIKLLADFFYYYKFALPWV